MKYLGILVIAVLVLAGSVAMADWTPITCGDGWTLYGDGGFNNIGNPSQTWYSTGFEFWVTVQPYLQLTIDHTKFWWDLKDPAIWGGTSETYYPNADGVQVAQIEFTTNWPAIKIWWYGIGWDVAPRKDSNYELVPQWTLKSGGWSLGFWYDHQTVGDGSYPWPVQHQWQPPIHPTGDHYEIWNRIKIPANKKPAPGTYVDRFTIAVTMAE